MAVWQPIKSQNLSYGLRLDPEFYQPKYFELEKKLLPISSPLSDVVAELNTGRTPEYYDENNTIPVVRSGDLDNFFIRDDLPSLLRTYPENKGIDLIKNNILISAIGRGSIGKVALYVGDGLATTVSEVVVLQKIKINSFLLAAVLSSKYGQMQIERQITGSTGQLHLIRQYLEKILIPKVEKLGSVIEKLLSEAQILSEKSEQLYPEAERELLERMEWDKVRTEHILNYIATSGDIMGDERLDPEFYQPKFENLDNHLKKIGAVPLGNFCPKISRGVSPVYVETGEALIVNSQNLSANGVIAVEELEKTELSFYQDENNKKARLKQFDVLVYATGAYIGRTNCWFENTNAIAGIDCLIIQPDAKICNPAYLALFLNSQAGLMQANRRASGSAQRHLYPNDLAKYQVFIPRDKNGKPDLVWQKKLALKVISANLANKEAKQKLEKAKQLVEKEIEKILKK